MSTQTAPDLPALVRERGPNAYVVTVSEQGAPHAVYAPVRWESGALVVDAGATTAANAAARPHVSLLFPVRRDGDYSLIVDGVAAVEAAAGPRPVRVTPRKAVLHRAGSPPDPTSACGADCVPLPTPAARVQITARRS
jgi:Pyridoxamine 5'-phosphate oxidase